MSARQLAGVLVLAGGAWWLYRNRAATTLPGTLLKAPTALPAAVSGGYTASTVARESGGNALAKNPNSTASGKYQFTRATWLKLGGQWGADLTKAFGGLTPSVAEQDARFKTLTAGNAAGLRAAGIATTNAMLYGAHVLGLPTALAVLTAAASTKLAGLVGSKVMAANRWPTSWTVGDFKAWLGARA